MTPRASEALSGCAELFFESRPGAPYRGGTAFVNTFIEKSVAACGFATTTSVVEAHHLNEMVKRAHGGGFRLFIYEDDYPRFQEAAKAIPARVNASDVMLPVPFLSNVDLYWLMRRSALSLCFDDYAEPFGLYPLDSVFNGCPVFTNGAGNLRHLLPAECGVTVVEAPSMYFGSAERRFRAAGEAASAIFRDMSALRSGARRDRWKAAIRSRYGSAGSDAGWSRFLRAVEGVAEVPALAHSSLKVGLSPLVRSWDPETGRVVADHGVLALDRKWRTTLSAALGRSIGEIARSRAATHETVYELFRLGVITWQGPFGEPVRLGRARRR